ncbi:hypothetical protein ACS8Y6_06500 [Salinisphaera sp. RV14]
MLLARELIHFEYLSFPAEITAAQRNKALALKIQAGSPYARTGHVALWDGNAAQVWFWDQARVSDIKRAVVLPETLAHPPRADGVRLLALSTGYEAQVWQRGALRASRFWPEPPARAAWQAFIRRAGQSASAPAEPPAAETPSWLERPYARGAGNELGQLRAQTGKLWIAGFAVLALALAWQGTRYFKYQGLQHQLQQHIEALRQQSQPLIRARAQARSRLQKVQTLQQHLDQPSPLVIIDDLLKTMPQNVHIEHFNLSGNTVKVLFSGQKLLNTAKIVGRIQTLPYVASVNTGDARNGQLQLTIGLAS